MRQSPPLRGRLRHHQPVRADGKMFPAQCRGQCGIALPARWSRRSSRGSQSRFDAAIFPECMRPPPSIGISMKFLRFAPAMIYCKAEKMQNFSGSFMTVTAARTGGWRAITLAVRRSCVRQAPGSAAAGRPASFLNAGCGRRAISCCGERTDRCASHCWAAVRWAAAFEFVQERTDMETPYVLSRRPRPG